MSLWFVAVPPVLPPPPHAASSVNAERAPANATATTRPGRRALPPPSHPTRSTDLAGTPGSRGRARERGEDQPSDLFDCLILSPLLSGNSRLGHPMRLIRCLSAPSPAPARRRRTTLSRPTAPRITAPVAN